MNFFRKGIKSLEAVEPSIRLIAQKHHIDYQLSGLDDGEDGEGESVNSYETSDAGELSFDYRQNKQGLDNVGKSRMSMEVILDYLIITNFSNRDLLKCWLSFKDVANIPE